MSKETQEMIDSFAPWINRVLLGVVAFFAIQFNATVKEISTKLDIVVTTQAVHNSRITVIENELKDQQKQIERFNADIASFYREYGYLFTPNAREKLSK